jgi:hypothetical protein
MLNEKIGENLKKPPPEKTKTFIQNGCEHLYRKFLDLQPISQFQ